MGLISSTEGLNRKKGTGREKQLPVTLIKLGQWSSPDSGFGLGLYLHHQLHCVFTLPTTDLGTS